MATTAAVLNIQLAVDSAKATSGLKQFDAKVKKTALDTKKTVDKLNAGLEVTPELDPSALQKGIKKARADLAILSKAKATPEIDIATAGATAHLKEFETQLAILTSKDYNVDVNVDRDGSAQNTFQRLWGWAMKLVDTIGSALTSAMQGAGSSMTGMGESAGQAGAETSKLGAVAGEAAAVVGVVLVAAVGAGVTALVALASSAIAAAGAIAALGIAAGALLIPFEALSIGAMARFKSDSETAGTSAFQLKQRLTDIADVLVKAFGPGIDAVFRAVGDNLTRMMVLVNPLKTLFLDFSKSVGRALNMLGKEFTRPEWIHFFAVLLKGAQKVSGPLMKVFIQLARIFRDIALAAMPLLIKGLGAFAQWMGEIGKKVPGVKVLRDIIGGLVEHLRSWWNLAKGLVGIFAGIFKAAVGPGKSLVDTLAKGAKSISDWVNSAEGQERIKQFFSDVMPLVNQLVTLFGQLALAALEIFQAIAPSLASLISGFNTVLKPVVFLIDLFNKIPASLRSWSLPGLFGPMVGLVVTVINVVKQLISWANKLGGVWKTVWGVIKDVVSAGVGFIRDRVAGIKSAFNDVIQWIKNAWKNVTNFIFSPFKDAFNLISGFVNDVIDILSKIPGFTSGTAGASGSGKGGSTTGNKNTSSNKTGGGGGGGGGGYAFGGVVSGTGSGDKVPLQAMVEPGEGVFVMNRNAMNAMQSWNDAFPRFQAGGQVPKLAKGGGLAGGLPSTGGLPDIFKQTGQLVLEVAQKYIKKHMLPTGGAGGTKPMDGKPVATWIWQILTKARGSGVGFNVSSGFRTFAQQQALQGGPGPVAPAGSSHHESTAYPGGAVDISPGAAALAGWLGTAKGTRVNNGRLIYAGSKDPVHFSHPYGGGYQKGGSVSEGHDLYKFFQPFGWWAHSKQFPTNPTKGSWGAMLAGYTQARNTAPGGNWHLDGGKLARMHPFSGKGDADHWRKQWLGFNRHGFQGGGSVPGPKHGAHWIKDLGGNVDVDEAATLLWQAGLSQSDAGQLARVIHTESGGNPKIVNSSSGATGLFQILGSVFPGNLKDPRINAINAAIKWQDAGGFGPWEGAPTGRAGRILLDRVGKAASTKTPKGKGKGGKGKTAKGPTGNADLITEAYGAALDQYAERTGLANELIGEGNLEALQRYQVGASQNPILGIASPGMPTPTPAMSTNPSPSELLAILAGSTPGLGGKASAATVHNHHIYVDGKALKGGISKVTRSQSKRGHRPLPSSKGK